jgi:hypothetical protein
MFGDRYEAFFIGHDDLRKHAARITPTIAPQRLFTRRTLNPLFEEDAGDTVTHLEASDTRANRYDLTGTVG